MQAVSHRMVLVIDEDAAFRDRLAALLAPLGVRVEAAQGEDDILEAVARRAPEAVFIAVDLPEKEGYGLFSRIKQARRRVPVVLVTSSISASDLKLHEKLKVHAEAYLDKRAATEEEIREAIESRLGISAAAEEPSSPPEEDRVTRSEEGTAGAGQVPSREVRSPGKRSSPGSPSSSTRRRPRSSRRSTKTRRFRRRSEDGRSRAKYRPKEWSSSRRSSSSSAQELDHARRDAEARRSRASFWFFARRPRRRTRGCGRSRRLSAAATPSSVVVKAKLTEIARMLLEARKDADGRPRAGLGPQRRARGGAGKAPAALRRGRRARAKARRRPEEPAQRDSSRLRRATRQPGGSSKPKSLR